MYRRFLFYNTTFCILSRRFGMLGDNVCTFNNNLSFINQYFLYQAWLFNILVITRNDNHLVTLPDIELWFKSCFHFLTVYPFLILPGDFYLINFRNSIWLLLRRTLVRSVLYSTTKELPE